MTEGAVRPARATDLDGIEEVERLAFESDVLSRRSLRRFLSVGTTAALVVAVGADIAGYAMIGFRKGSAAGRVFTLAVRPDAGRRGWGAALLAACEAEARRRDAVRVTLEVRADNGPALRLYAAAGYQKSRTFEDYYEDGTAAIRLAKTLTTA